jgi:hypothetical protein
MYLILSHLGIELKIILAIKIGVNDKRPGSDTQRPSAHPWNRKRLPRRRWPPACGGTPPSPKAMQTVIVLARIFHSETGKTTANHCSAGFPACRIATPEPFRQRKIHGFLLPAWRCEYKA